MAQGGQASVYARGDTAFKVFTDPTAVPHPAKLSALRALTRPGLITPDAELTTPGGARAGYTMRFLDGWGPLCRLFSSAYRQRNHLDLAAIGRLVLELQELVAYAHSHSALIVDLNELNALVDPAHTKLALIDLDSWQLAGFPATALAETVRDRHSSGFSPGTDWFSYAILSFQMFSGIHPFRGRHPTVKTLDERMTADLSVFHPDVVLPPMVDLDALPPTWRDWYEAVFVHRERCAPPTSLDTRAIPMPRALPGATIAVRTAFEAPQPILGLASWQGRTWVWSAQGTYEERQRIGPPPPPRAQPFRAPAGLAFAHLEAGALRIALGDGTRVETALQAQALSSHRGVLHARVGRNLLQLELVSRFGRPMLAPRQAAQISPHATDLFRGLAVTRALGTTWITLLGPGTSEQRRVPELDDRRIVDGTAASGVAVVVTREDAGWARHVVTRRGVRSTSTAVPSAELIVLPTGIALVPTDTGLELFAVADPLGAVRTVSTALPDLLQEVGGHAGFVRGSTVHTLTLRR